MVEIAQVASRLGTVAGVCKAVVDRAAPTSIPAVSRTVDTRADGLRTVVALLHPTKWHGDRPSDLHKQMQWRHSDRPVLIRWQTIRRRQQRELASALAVGVLPMLGLVLRPDQTLHMGH